MSNSNLIKVSNNTTESILTLLSTSDLVQDNNDQGTPVYGQKKEVLKTQSGSETIPTDSSEQYLLKQMSIHKGSKSILATVYDLSFCEGSFAVPMLFRTVSDIMGPFPDISVTTADKKKMEKASTFCQQIQTYSNSQLVKKYADALKKAITETTASSDNATQKIIAIEQATSAFLKTTKGYKDLTFSEVNTVDAYYKDFPFVWAGYTSKKYWLYSSDGTKSKFIGLVTMTKPATVDLSKANGGYEIYLQLAKNPSNLTTVAVKDTQTALTYDNGMFVDDVKVDIPTAGLMGIFHLKSQMTGSSSSPDPTQDKMLPFLTGTVYGARCLGLDSPQTIENKKSPF